MKKWVICNPSQATDIEAAAVMAGIEMCGKADALIVKADTFVPEGTAYLIRDPEDDLFEVLDKWRNPLWH